MFHVYLLASRPHGTLYVGVTSDLVRRVWNHTAKAVPGFTAQYGVGRLVCFEARAEAHSAIRREKQIKEWRRAWKVRLIEEQNPEWADLYPSIVGDHTSVKNATWSDTVRRHSGSRPSPGRRISGRTSSCRSLPT